MKQRRAAGFVSLKGKTFKAQLKFFQVLLWDLAAVIAALILSIYTQNNHFGEGRFISFISGIQLAVIAWLAYKIGQRRRTTPTRSLWRDVSRIWTILALGFLFLTADELLQIHEKTDFAIHKVFRIQETALTDHIDDTLIGLYAVVGVALLALHRAEFLPYRRSFPYFVIGFLLFCVMVALDVITNRNTILLNFFDPGRADVFHVWLGRAEESSKLFAQAFFILGFCWILEKGPLPSSSHHTEQSTASASRSRHESQRPSPSLPN